jgi:prolyl-tRNA editing enzyme YbaK/EbsC (Cys-tRNA(Pro) deacylase)
LRHFPIVAAAAMLGVLLREVPYDRKEKCDLASIAVVAQVSIRTTLSVNFCELGSTQSPAARSVGSRFRGPFLDGQGRVVSSAVAAGGLAQLKSFLRDRGVSFDVIAHPRSETAAAEARAAQLPQEQTAKTVVLHTSGGYRFAVLAASDRLDLHKAADALDVRRHALRLATEADTAADFSQYEVGAIPPIGPDTPLELVDLRLLDYARVLCPAGDHEHSLLVDPMDIVRVTGARSVDVRQD